MLCMHLQQNARGSGWEPCLNGSAVDAAWFETDWLPNKKSWRMVSADGEEDDEEDTRTIVVEMRQKIETLETGLTYMKGLMEHVAFPTST